MTFVVGMALNDIGFLASDTRYTRYSEPLSQGVLVDVWDHGVTIKLDYGDRVEHLVHPPTWVKTRRIGDNGWVADTGHMACLGEYTISAVVDAGTAKPRAVRQTIRRTYKRRIGPLERIFPSVREEAKENKHLLLTTWGGLTLHEIGERGQAIPMGDSNVSLLTPSGVATDDVVPLFLKVAGVIPVTLADNSAPFKLLRAIGEMFAQVADACESVSRIVEIGLLIRRDGKIQSHGVRGSCDELRDGSDEFLSQVWG